MGNLYRIISDGSCDLSFEEAEREGVTIVPFYVSFDMATYKKEGLEVGVRDFYQQMVDNQGVYPKSSLPSVQDYVDVFLPCVKEGTDIICICISTKFSGSYQSASSAKNVVLEEYPSARITVIDCRVNTVLQGMYVLEAARLCREGIAYEECVKRLLSIIESGRIFFTVGSIDYLQHGGRIGKLAGTAASVLGIKPLITLREGEIFPSGVARGRRRSKSKVIELLEAYIKECSVTTDNYRICIGFGYDKDEAIQFRKEAVARLASYGITEKDLPICQIGATISVYTGPYPLGFGIIRRA